MSTSNDGISRYDTSTSYASPTFACNKSFTLGGAMDDQDSSYDVAGNVDLGLLVPIPFFQTINVNANTVVTLPDTLADGLPGVPNGVRMIFFVNGAFTLTFNCVVRAGGSVISVVRNTAAAGVTFVEVANGANSQAFPTHSYVEVMSSNFKWLITAQIPV